MFRKTRIGAVVHYVTDIRRTERFYRETLGLETTLTPGEEPGSHWLQAETAGGVSLIFFEAPGKPGASPIVVFELENGGIDGVVEALAKNGATIVTPVSHAPGGWSADFADPDGHTLSLWQSTEKPR